MNFSPIYKVKITSSEELMNIIQSDLPIKVYELEKEDMYLSSDIIPIDETTYSPYCYLYHGIRFQKHLEKLENILKSGKILASKYIPNCFSYDENCNKGEYVSLTNYNNTSGYNIFIIENISLLVSPRCEAYLTKFVDYETWEKIKNKNTKNLYSYMVQEYMCKDYITLDLVKAIGVPYKYYSLTKGIEYADTILNDVKGLIDKYNINVGIVDTSNYNRTLISPKNKEELGVNYGKSI